MGGGNYLYGGWSNWRLGLSPRGRGKLREAIAALKWPGSIPAWAGETFDERYHRRILRVYPRVGGGNQDEGLELAIFERSIPAWAGETARALQVG